jgi:RNA polymerase sigma factor (sigma-70 family)
LASKFTPLVRAIVCRVLGPDGAGDWDDASQTAFCRLFAKLDQFRNECPFCKYVAVVAVNVALTVRDRGGARADSIEQMGLEPATPDPLVSRVTRDCIEEHQRRFPSAWRRALELKDEGLTHEQIAERLGVQRRTIQNWLTHMRERLRECV